MRRCSRAICAVALAAACTPVPPMPDPPPSHPASAAADEAPERAPSQTLVMPQRTPALGAPTTGTGAGKPMRGH